MIVYLNKPRRRTDHEIWSPIAGGIQVTDVLMPKSLTKAALRLPQRRIVSSTAYLD